MGKTNGSNCNINEQIRLTLIHTAARTKGDTATMRRVAKEAKKKGISLHNNCKVK